MIVRQNSKKPFQCQMKRPFFSPFGAVRGGFLFYLALSAGKFAFSGFNVTL
jgi:hypothetical protein